MSTTRPVSPISLIKTRDTQPHSVIITFRASKLRLIWTVLAHSSISMVVPTNIQASGPSKVSIWFIRPRVVASVLPLLLKVIYRVGLPWKV